MWTQVAIWTIVVLACALVGLWRGRRIAAYRRAEAEAARILDDAAWLDLVATLTVETPLDHPQALLWATSARAWGLTVAQARVMIPDMVAAMLGPHDVGRALATSDRWNRPLRRRFGVGR